jgi:hypothetical protein
MSIIATGMEAVTGDAFVGFPVVGPAYATIGTPKTSIVRPVSSPAFDADAMTVTDPAREFIRTHGLQSYVDFARTQIAELFTVSGAGTIRKEHDPEFPDEWVTICVRAWGDVEKISDAYDEYIRRWVRKVPSTQIRKIRLGLGVA